MLFIPLATEFYAIHCDSYCNKLCSFSTRRMLDTNDFNDDLMHLT